MDSIQHVGCGDRRDRQSSSDGCLLLETLGEADGTAGERMIEEKAAKAETSDGTSLFQQAWWVEAAAGSALERTEVRWGGQVVASLPFVRVRTMGFTLLDMPPYTRTLGPILSLPASKPARRLRNMHDAIRELMEALPRHDRYQAMLGPDDPTAFSLALSGCSLGQNFTFRMPAVWDADQHWNELDQKTRNLIRTAGKKLEVRCESRFEVVLELSERERGAKDRSNFSTLRRLAEAAERRGQLVTLTAHQDDGRVVGAAAVIWDDQVMYFWQSVRDSQGLRSGATSLLIWEAMLLARRKGLIFDVDGYHSLPAARFVSRFGMTPKVRTSVLHLSKRGRIVQAAGRLIGRGGGFGVQPIAETLPGE